MDTLGSFSTFTLGNPQTTNMKWAQIVSSCSDLAAGCRKPHIPDRTTLRLFLGEQFLKDRNYQMHH